MGAPDGKIQTFKKFWPHYIGEHRKPLTRGLHYAGTTAGLLCALKAARTGKLRWIGVGLLCGYGPAWIGHFFLEKNRPATFTYPVWSFRADFKMLKLAATGRIRGEVTRLYGSPDPANGAPQLAEE